VIRKTKSRKKPAVRAGNRPAKKPARQTKRAPCRKRLFPEVEEAWDNFAANLKQLYQASLDREKEICLLRKAAKGAGIRVGREDLQSHYDKPESVLKREVYRFVITNFTPRTIGRLERVLDPLIERSREIRLGFTDNNLHWILLALSSEEISIRASEINKYSKQLLYALRHRIDPDLLIGFLYQTGSPEQIAEKVRDPTCREEWYLTKTRR